MELGEPDKSGQAPSRAPGGFGIQPHSNTIISAIGQAVDGFCIGNESLIDKWGNIGVDPATMQTALPWVFSGGDCVTGPDIAIAAIGAGKRAAESIDEYVRTGQLPQTTIPIPAPKATGKTCRRTLSRS